MKTTEKYNGWTNYATWRVNLEIFDGLYSDMEGERQPPKAAKNTRRRLSVKAAKA